MSGMDAIKFREDMTGKQLVRSLDVYQRELGPGFGWVCFAAGVTVPEAQRLYESEPATVDKLACIFDGLWETSNAEQ